MKRPTLTIPREVVVSWPTLMKLFAAVVAMWAVVRLWPPFRLFLLSILLAITLSPVVARLEKRKLGRGQAVALIALVIILLAGALCFFVLPPLTQQLSDLWKSLPEYRRSLALELERGVLGSRIVLPLLDLPRSPEFDALLAKPLTWGSAAAGAVGSVLIVIILSLYLLLDGKKTVAWFLAYVPREHRGRMSEMVPEVFSVVRAYTTGQLIASALFATFSFAVLTLLHVPAALPLALLAGLCDVIPVAGILLATAAATVCALVVSPSSALVVLVLYAGYHLFEAYVLVPVLYGNRLRLSTLAVLLAILAGGTLGGVIGAVLALPIVAAYPVFEKHWMDEYLHPDVVEDHSALRDTDDPRQHEAVVDAVLQGSSNPVG